MSRLSQLQDAIPCFNTALSLNPTYTAAQVNLGAAMGKGQISTYTMTPTPTPAPWYLGGIAPTSATPTPVAATPTMIETQTVQTTAASQTTLETPPVPTTDHIHPPVTGSVLAGLGAAAILLARAGKGKTR